MILRDTAKLCKDNHKRSLLTNWDFMKCLSLQWRLWYEEMSKIWACSLNDKEMNELFGRLALAGHALQALMDIPLLLTHQTFFLRLNSWLGKLLLGQLKHYLYTLFNLFWKYMQGPSKGFTWWMRRSPFQNPLLQSSKSISSSRNILLMEEILHHMGCLKPGK